jgi:GDP-L-fucose synthase
LSRFGNLSRFDLVSSHVLPALIVKAHRAKLANDPTMTMWGTGRPRRELLYVDDLADACVFLMKNYSDGAPRKLLDCARINAMGWRPKVTLKEGVGLAYRCYLEHAR